MPQDAAARARIFKIQFGTLGPFASSLQALLSVAVDVFVCFSKVTLNSDCQKLGENLYNHRKKRNTRTTRSTCVIRKLCFLSVSCISEVARTVAHHLRDREKGSATSEGGREREELTAGTAKHVYSTRRRVRIEFHIEKRYSFRIRNCRANKYSYCLIYKKRSKIFESNQFY